MDLTGFAELKREVDKFVDSKTTNSEDENVLSFRARRKAKLRAERACSTPSDALRKSTSKNVKEMSMHTTLELVQASEEYQAVALTFVLHELSYANTFNALELYLSLFEIYNPKDFSSACTDLLKKLGYAIRVICIDSEDSRDRYLQSKGWTMADIMRWTDNQYPLTAEERLVGFSIYSLLVGKELNSYNYTNWVNKRAAVFYKFIHVPGQKFWSVDKFTSQLAARHIYQLLYKQPLRRFVFISLFHVLESLKHATLLRTVLSNLKFTNMTHIELIMKSDLKNYPELLDLPPIKSHVGDLQAALKFVQSVPEGNRPFIRLVYDHEECRVLSCKKLLPFLILIRLLETCDAKHLTKTYQGLEIPVQMQGTSAYLKSHIEKVYDRSMQKWLARIKSLHSSLDFDGLFGRRFLL